MENRAIIYGRLSREDEDKLDGMNINSKSIENQIKLLTEYAKEKDFMIYKVIYDDGYSGADFNRPGFQKLMEETKRNRYNILLIKDLSRLGRSMHRVGDLIENVFPSYNIRVIAVNDNYDSATYSSDEPIVLKNFLNEYYLKEFCKKMRVVRRHQATTRHLNFYPKFGYRYEEGRKEVIDEYSAEIVKRAFNLVANENLSTLEVAEIYNAEGVPTRSYYQTQILGLKSLHRVPAKKWVGTAIWEIVSDYEYCGHSVNWTRHRKEEQIILKNTHPAIIEESLYWRAKENIDKHSRSKKRLDHLGRLLFDRKNDKHLLYAQSRLSRDKDCYFLRLGTIQQYKINARMIEDILYKDALKIIKQCQEDSDKLYQIAKHRLFGKRERENLILREKLDKTNEEYSKLLEQMFAGKIPEILFNKLSKEKQHTIKDLERRIEKTSIDESKLAMFEIKFKRFIDSMEKLPIDRLELIRTVISKVYINKVTDKNFDITILYKFDEF